jgi:hypothetical protein
MWFGGTSPTLYTHAERSNSVPQFASRSLCDRSCQTVTSASNSLRQRNLHFHNANYEVVIRFASANLSRFNYVIVVVEVRRCGEIFDFYVFV